MVFDIGQGKYENIYNPSTGTYQLVKVSGSGPAIIGSSEGGTYTSAQGVQISRSQAMAQGTVDRPGEAASKLASIRAPTEQPVRPVGLEALKQAEVQAARQEIARRQSEQATTPEEARAIQRMLKSPTAQFSSQEAAQRGYELASRYDRSFAPEQVRATLAPRYTPQEEQPKEKTRFFYPAPREQIGIRPSFPTPPRPGSLAEINRMRTNLTLYKPAMRLIDYSERLQRRLEERIGYSESASAPTKFVAGAGTAVTSLPGFVGSGLLGYEALAKFPRKTLTQAPKSALSIGSQFVEQAKTKPIETAGQITGMVLGGRLLSRGIRPSEGLKTLFRSEEAAVKVPDIWSRIPTMRESAARAGKELTRKIEFGRTFKEPSGAGVVSSSGRQALVSIQQSPTVQVARHAGPRYSRSIVTVDVTAPEMRTTTRLHAPAKSITEQKSILTEYFGEQKQAIIQEQKTRSLLIPSYIHKQQAKQMQSVPQLHKQIQQQISKQKPIVVQREKIRYSNIPMSIQAQASFMKSLQVQVPKQLQKQVTPQKIEPLRIQKPTDSKFQRIEDRKQIEYPKTITTLPSIFKTKKPKKLRSRKYITSLSGKTYKQLQAEFKKRQRRKPRWKL